MKIGSDCSDKMTWLDIVEKFHATFPNADVDDFRPSCPEMFEKDKIGVTIWLENGDMLVYYPKEANNERTSE